MKKRIFYIIISLSVIIVTVTGILSSLVYYNFYVNDSKEQIKAIASMSASEDWSDRTSIEKSAEKIVKSVNYSIRISIIEEDGSVIYDNYADYETIGNHRDRPEIVNAFNNGFGEDTRFSKTLKNDAYYNAVKLENGSVLRLSRELDSIRNVFVKILPILISILLLLVALSFVIASYITSKVISPVKQMTESIDNLIDLDSVGRRVSVYEELEPFANKIKEQKIKINEYINEIKRDRDTIGVLTENMREGFILVNKDKKILSINSSGKRMIDNEKFVLKDHKHMLELTRNPQIITNIDASINENKHIVSDIDMRRHHYRYYFSPVSEKKDSVDGLMILIEDITVQKNAENMRQEFSSNVSHELKTPLTTMIGFAEMIHEGLITDFESIKKYCGMINKEGLRLISLMEDIMRLSKIEEKISIYDSDKVNLKEISMEVFKTLLPKAKENNISLILNSDELSMKANRNYIYELISNLVENSIKYNKQNGKVQVDIYEDNKNICIDVRDSGLGIPEEHQDRIFERFYRVDKSRSKETGGTGLGLSIVKHIVELYGGEIELRSKVDIGTEIFIRFLKA